MISDAQGLAEVNAAKTRYPDAWKSAHVEGDPARYDFIHLLAEDIHAKYPEVALNGKRGNPSDISMDALNIRDESGPGRTPDGKRCWVVDVIQGAGGSNPQPTWNRFSDPQSSSGAHVLPGASPQPPTPIPPSAPSFPYPDENTTVKAYQERIRKAYSDAGRAFPDPNDSDAFRHFCRYGYDCQSMPEPESANKHIKELRDALGVGAERG